MFYTSLIYKVINILLKTITLKYKYIFINIIKKIKDFIYKFLINK